MNCETVKAEKGSIKRYKTFSIFLFYSTSFLDFINFLFHKKLYTEIEIE